MPWNQFSESKLQALEQKILSVLKSAYNTHFVRIKWGSTGTDERIWTISMNTESPKTPLVLLHGFAAGIGFWVRNFDSLSKDRPLYAMDLLGFGRSSRPEFNKDSLKAEQQMVDSIEAWRKQMKLEKFILLGHSMGGYLATSYAISYPDHIKHLILADPWGFGDKSKMPPRNPPLWIKILGVVLYPFTGFNPLATVRVLGPFGPWLIQKTRGDIFNNFEDVIEDKTIIPNYIYHCNAQNPTGETAFQNMKEGFGWARNPMINRITHLRKDVPITFMYGSETWIDKIGPKIKDMRPDCFVDVQFIQKAGHHLYADHADEFNKIILDTCNAVDDEENIVNVLPLKNEGHSLKLNEQRDKCEIETN